MKKQIEPPQRIIFLDFFRGFFILGVLFMHGIAHLLWWHDKTSIPDEAVPLWAIILLSPFLLLATWAPCFAFVSGASNGFVQHRVMSRHDSSSGKPSPLNGVVRGLFYNGLVLHLVSLIHNTIIHFGYDNWGIAGAPQFEIRTLITGYLETGVLSLPSVEFLFYTDAIALMGTTNIILAILLFFLWRKNGFSKTTRNFIIILSLGVVWFAVSPLLQDRFALLFFEKLAAAERITDYFGILPLKFLVGPPHATFPNVGFGIIGLAFGLTIALRFDFSVIKRYGLILGLGFSGIAIIILIKHNLIDGNPLMSSGSVGTSLPIQIHLLNIGLMTLLSTLLIKLMEYQPPEKRKRIAKNTRFFRRFSLLAMTIYMCESMVVLLVIKVYVPLWGSDIQSSPPLYILMLAIMVVISITIWHFILILWERVDFKYSFEWFVVRIVGIMRGRTSTRLNSREILYDD